MTSKPIRLWVLGIALCVPLAIVVGRCSMDMNDQARRERDKQNVVAEYFKQQTAD